MLSEESQARGQSGAFAWLFLPQRIELVRQNHLQGTASWRTALNRHAKAGRTSSPSNASFSGTQGQGTAAFFSSRAQVGLDASLARHRARCLGLGNASGPMPPQSAFAETLATTSARVMRLPCHHDEPHGCREKDGRRESARCKEAAGDRDCHRPAIRQQPHDSFSSWKAHSLFSVDRENPRSPIKLW